MPRKNKKTYKNKVDNWAICAIIIAILIFFIGINFATELTPKDLPHDSKTLYGSNVSINFKCFPRGEERSYIFRSDKLDCDFWYNTTEFTEAIIEIPYAQLKPVGETSVESSDIVQRRTIRNGELVSFTLGRPNGFERDDLYKVKLSVIFYSPISPGDTLEDDFNVHSSDEIAQRNLNKNLIVVMLLTGIFGVFTGIYNLRKLTKPE